MSENNGDRIIVVLKIAGIIACLYFFIVGVGGMGHAFKLFGREFAEKVFALTASPFFGLFVGILATSIVQSSATSTSIIVGLVAGGAVSLEGAIPMIMGANIGTSITSMLVSLGHITRPHEFQRAFGAASLHTSFNLMAVAIIFPLELMTGFLTNLSISCATLFQNAGGMRLSNPLKAATEPTIEFLAFVVLQQPIVLLLVTIILTYGMLIGIVKLLRSMVLVKVEKFFDEFLFKTAGRAMVFGFILTVMVQSSTIPTSAIIPLAAAGILRLLQIYPFSLGCNLGTTITAMLAALATGSELAITVAFSHLLFNISGILLIWCIPPIRRIPLRFAEWVAARSLHNRLIPFGIIAMIFFIIPFLLILINHLI